MNFVEHPSCNALLKKPEAWDPDVQGVNCEDLRVFVSQIEDTGMMVIRSYWKPTEEEIMQLAKGAYIALEVFGEVHPPVALEVVE